MTRSRAIKIFNRMTVKELEKIYSAVEGSANFERIISYIAEKHND